nr:hypothetical protein [Candidatus Levybacteria bacterium]
MAKVRKTREQKKLADLRHNFTHSLAKNTYPKAKITLEVKENPITSPKTQSVISLNEYPYLIKDLSKTGILTALILGFQIVLFFLLKNHTLKIPGLIY